MGHGGGGEHAVEAWQERKEKKRVTGKKQENKKE